MYSATDWAFCLRNSANIKCSSSKKFLQLEYTHPIKDFLLNCFPWFCKFKKSFMIHFCRDALTRKNILESSSFKFYPKLANQQVLQTVTVLCFESHQVPEGARGFFSFYSLKLKQFSPLLPGIVIFWRHLVVYQTPNQYTGHTISLALVFCSASIAFTINFYFIAPLRNNIFVLLGSSLLPTNIYF